MNEEGLIKDCIDLFKKYSNKEYIPMYLAGSVFVEHFNLTEADIEHFFNLMCYELEVLEINPGEPEMSYRWEKNNFGLFESYRTSLERDIKLNNLGL